MSQEAYSLVKKQEVITTINYCVTKLMANKRKIHKNREHADLIENPRWEKITGRGDKFSIWKIGTKLQDYFEIL